VKIRVTISIRVWDHKLMDLVIGVIDFRSESDCETVEQAVFLALAEIDTLFPCKRYEKYHISTLLIKEVEILK